MAKPDKKKKESSGSKGAGGYFKRTLDPLPCLFFLLPLLVIYEIGTFLYATDPTTGQIQTIRARSILQSMFELVGVTGYSLPVYLVIGILLLWHLIRRDKFAIEPRLYGKMAIESAMWALPLVAIMTLVAKYAHPQAGLSGGPDPGVKAMLVFSVGAGIYEELLFRLMGLSLIRMGMQHILRAKPEPANYVAIIVTSIAFALYHYNPVDFTLNAALQYCLAGVFFSGVYAYRGFGIVVGTHAMYDVMVTFIHWYAAAK